MKRFILKPLGYLTGLVVVLAVVLTAAGLGFRAYKQSEVRASGIIDTPNGIESLERAQINGSMQWLYIRGHDTANPVLLFVHGGPGMPEMPAARQMGLRLEEHFTVVHWDQRASGKSSREDYDEADLTIATFHADTIEVTNLLRERFSKEKIYLVGHSWGSALGVLAVRDNPELYHAFIGMGQLVNLKRNEEISLEYAREQARLDGNEEALAELADLRPPYSEDPMELGVQRKWLYYYGGGSHGITFPELGMIYLWSPEYSILDLFSAATKMTAVSTYMWPEIGGIDFFTQAPALEVPVYFFVGVYDYNTPFELTEEYYEMLEAPAKHLIWFENSSHMMNVSDPDHFQDMLINRVLAETGGE